MTGKKMIGLLLRDLPDLAVRGSLRSPDIKNGGYGYGGVINRKKIKYGETA